MIGSFRSAGKGQVGEVLPHVPALSQLYALGVAFRRGQLIMVAGRPGAMKSSLAMWLCAQWHVPTLYASADMGEFTATIRDASICTGLTADEAAIVLDDPDRRPEIVATMRERSTFRFIHDAMPSLQDIDEEVLAWVECYDEYPTCIILDNLMDLAPISDSEYASNKQLLLELKAMARNTGALVAVLHHNREESDPRWPAPVRAIQGKVSQTPELVLSVALDGTTFRIAPVKNRSGASFPMGDTYMELTADASRTSFKAKTPYLHSVGRW